MPRKRKTPGAAADPRGGVRQGQPGKPYPNRSDMRAQAVRAAPAREYGGRVRQEEAQRVVPLPQTPPPPTGPPVGGAPPAGGGGLPPGYVAPGELGAFDRPSERPMEPVTTGIPSGPGAGPEALQAFNKPDPDLEALRPYLPTLEILASLPDTSPTARNFVRRLRGSMPPPREG